MEEHVDSKSTEKQSEASAAGIATFDMYDIGFDTQMAAEAIEVLACGHPIGCSPADAYQGIGSTVNNLVRGVTEEGDHSVSHSPRNTACYDIGEIAKNAKRRKRSARKYSRGSSIPAKKQTQFLELGPELAPKMQGKRFKLFGETQLCCSNSAIENESSGRKSPNPVIEQRKAEGDLRRNKLRVFGKNTSSSVPLGKGHSQGHCVIVSPSAHQSRQTGLWGRLKRSEGQSFNPGERMVDIVEHGMLVYRRRRSRLISDPYNVTSVEKKNCELDYSSEEAHKNELTNFSNLDKIWNYTRRKRTRHTIPNRSSGINNLNALFRLVDGKDSKLHCQERMGRDSDMKGKAELSSSTTPRAPWHSSEDGSNRSMLGQNSDKPSLAGSSVYARAKTNMRVSHMGPALYQASMQSDRDSTSLAEGIQSKCMSVAVSNKTLEPSDSEFTAPFSSKCGESAESSKFMGYNYHKKPCDRNVPKSTLLRELIRLGVPESMHVLSWKDLRRRKEMAHVRVLFSQHLEGDIIKQQKKVNFGSFFNSKIFMNHYSISSFISR